MIALLYKSGIRDGTAVTKLKNLNATKVIRSQGARGQVVTFNYQGKGGHGFYEGQQKQSSDRNSRT